MHSAPADTAGTGGFWKNKLRPHFAASMDSDSEWSLPERALLKDVALDLRDGTTRGRQRCDVPAYALGFFVTTVFLSMSVLRMITHCTLVKCI